MLLDDLIEGWSFPKLQGCFAEADATPPAGGAGSPEGTEATEPKDGETPPGDAPKDGETLPEPAVKVASEPRPATEDWRDRQINRQHRKIKELEGQTAKTTELEAENARLSQLLEARNRQAPQAGDNPPAPVPPAAPRPIAAATPSTDPVAQARFELELEQVGQKLNAEYKDDWATAAKNFEKMGGIPPQVMQGVLATDDAAYVMVQLGKNPDRFQEILDLPPAKQQTALVKIALEKTAVKTAPKPSGAPAPVEHVRPVGSTAPAGNIDLYDGKVEDDRWYAERVRQKRESSGRPWSVQRAGR